MGILDPAIGQIRNYMRNQCQGQPVKTFDYDGKGCSWPVGGKKNIVLGQEQVLSWEIPVRNPCP